MFNKRTLTAVVACLATCQAARAETMPQLDFANKLLTAQVVWGALIFVVFYLLVSRWGLPRVGAVLAMRAETIATDLDRARTSKANADRAVTELEATRRQAHAQSQAAVADATQKAKAEASRLAAAQDARLDAQLAESEAQIASARTAAMGAIRQVATEAAAAVVTRLVGTQADEGRVHDAVGAILAERGLPA